MNTVGKYLTHASTQLNDQRYGGAFTRWGRRLLLEYMNLGLAEIATYFPGDFNKQIDVVLGPGREQKIEGTAKIVAVVSNADGSPITEMDGDLSNSFALFDRCPPDITFVDGTPTYRAVSYAVRDDNPRAFYIEPPVPDGLKPTVRVSVDGAVLSYSLADWDTEHNIPPKYINALMEFMLGKAKGLNTESVSSRAESEDHFRRFYSVLGINYKQSSRYKSGYYEGKRGDGDPRASA